jgi:hypothetical protein
MDWYQVVRFAMMLTVPSLVLRSFRMDGRQFRPIAQSPFRTTLPRLCDAVSVIRNDSQNCPSWHSDLLLCHELSFNLYEEETSNEYDYAQFINEDARATTRFIPIRDELQLSVYAGTHYDTTQFIPDEIEEGKT